jgi:hypothetical protein
MTQITLNDGGNVQNGTINTIYHYVQQVRLSVGGWSESLQYRDTESTVRMSKYPRKSCRKTHNGVQYAVSYGFKDVITRGR